jgi:hypothetical protein
MSKIPSELWEQANKLKCQMEELAEFHRARDLNNLHGSPENMERLARAMERLKISVDEPPDAGKLET